MDALTWSKAWKTEEQTCRRSCWFPCCTDTAWIVKKDLEMRTSKNTGIVWNSVSDFHVLIYHSEWIFVKKGKYFQFVLGKKMTAWYLWDMHAKIGFCTQKNLLDYSKMKYLHGGFFKCLSKLLVSQPMVRVVPVFSVKQWNDGYGKSEALESLRLYELSMSLCAALLV